MKAIEETTSVGATLRDRYASALTFEHFLAEAQDNAELWRAMAKRAQPPADLVERLQARGGVRYLLVLLEDWCGDAVNTIPLLAGLAEQVPTLELRVLRRDENLDLMDAHRTGSARAIPVVMVLDEEFREVGWWGSRPRALQEWVTSPEAQAMDKTERYREIRRWYARDRGQSTLEELAPLLGVPDYGRTSEVQSRVA